MLMTMDYRQGYLETVRATLSVVVYPVQFVVHLPIAMSRWIAESAVSRSALVEENARLRSQNLVLQSRFQKYAALEAENTRLRELLQSSLRAGERVLVADLMAIELEPSSRQVVLNKGAQHDVYVGQPIVDAGGIMGQIVHVGPFTSTAMLITDVSHALPVVVNRSGLQAIAVGTGSEDKIELIYVPNYADVREGDLIVSSGIGGRFPPGYPVGEVLSVDIDHGEPFAKVNAKPSAHMLRSREVLLVWPHPEGADVGKDGLAAAE
jgi:rod shape-determining protein MreC